MTSARATDRVALLIASAGFVGFAPVASGTFGSLAGLALFWLLRSTGLLWLDVLAAVLAFALGTWAAHATERALARPDPGIVVIDEVAGMLITLALLPASITISVVGFLLFRLLDVIKPFPADRFERAPGGVGIMLDDVMAGIYANLALRGLIALRPEWFL